MKYIIDGNKKIIDIKKGTISHDYIVNYIKNKSIEGIGKLKKTWPRISMYYDKIDRLKSV